LVQHGRQPFLIRNASPQTKWLLGYYLLTLRMTEQGNISGDQEANSGSGSQDNPSNAGNAKSLNEIMEVHHHPDIHHKRKKFKEYFIEFIMIFLAVTLGFFAEGLRENISERARAKEYALMLLKDVINDTIELHTTMARYQSYIGSIDTLKLLRRSEKDNLTDIDFFFYCQPVFSASRMPFNDATLQQVKNSGNLRFFHSLKLKEKISDYDNITRKFSLRQDFELNWVPILNGFYNSLFAYDTKSIVEEKLSKGYSLDSLKREHYNFLIRDTVQINKFLNFCDYRKNIWETRITTNIIPIIEVARQLIAVLKNEYDFSENE
jgi:hypothetical protein